MKKNIWIKLTLAAIAAGVTAYLAIEGTRRVRKATEKTGGLLATVKSWFDFSGDYEEECEDDGETEAPFAWKREAENRPAMAEYQNSGMSKGESLSPVIARAGAGRSSLAQQAGSFVGECESEG